MIGLLLREALDRLCVRLNMYLVAIVINSCLFFSFTFLPSFPFSPPNLSPVFSPLLNIIYVIAINIIIKYITGSNITVLICLQPLLDVALTVLLKMYDICSGHLRAGNASKFNAWRR